MAKREIIEYIITLGQANAKQQIDLLADSIQKLGDKAKVSGKAMADNLEGTAKKLNQNQLLSQFETVASLLTQVGGNVSKVGILASSAARPIYILGTVFGGTALAIAGATAGVGLFVIAIGKAFSATEAWVGSMARSREELIEQGIIGKDAAKGLQEYDRALTRLENATALLEATTANKLSPAFQEIVDSKTGLVRALNEIGIATEETEFRFSNLFKTLGVSHNSPLLNAIGTAMDTLSATGGVTFTSGNPVLAGMGGFGANPITGHQGEFPEAIGPTKDDLKEGGRLLAEQKKLDAEQKRLAREAEAAQAAALRETAAARDAANAANERILGESEQGTAAREREAVAEQAAEDALLLRESMDALRGSIDYDREQARQIAQDEAELARFEVDQQRQRQQNAGAFASAFTGADVGSIVSSAGGGPIGAAIGAVASGAAYDSLESLFDQVFGIYEKLPEELGKLSSELVPEMIRAAPEMAANFAFIGPSVAIELVKSGPALFESVIDALLELPEAFAAALEDQIPFQKVRDEVSGGSAFGEGSLGRAALGGAAAGTLVGGPAGGLVGGLVGAGVHIAKNVGGGRSDSSSARTQVFNIVSPNPRDTARQMRQLQGNYGYGETLEPDVL